MWFFANLATSMLFNTVEIRSEKMGIFRVYSQIPQWRQARNTKKNDILLGILFGVILLLILLWTIFWSELNFLSKIFLEFKNPGTHQYGIFIFSSISIAAALFFDLVFIFFWNWYFFGKRDVFLEKEKLIIFHNFGIGNLSIRKDFSLKKIQFLRIAKSKRKNSRRRILPGIIFDYNKKKEHLFCGFPFEENAEFILEQLSKDVRNDLARL